MDNNLINRYINILAAPLRSAASGAYGARGAPQI